MSVGVSFATSALAVPGISTPKKIVSTIAIAIDATIDVSATDTEHLFNGSKSMTRTAVDIASAIIPGKILDQTTSSFNKAVSTDISSYTISKGEKNALLNAQKVVNSTSFQTGASAITDYIGGATGGIINERKVLETPLKKPIREEDIMKQYNDAIQVAPYK